MNSNKNITSPSLWCKRRFGDFLEKFDPREQTFIKHSIEEVFSEHDKEKENYKNNNRGDPRSKVVGLYFTPHTSMKFLNEDITEDLKEAFIKVNENLEENRRFEVIQICFPQKAPPLEGVFFDDSFEKNCKNRFMNVPWFALPADKVGKCIRLRHYYGVKDGEFALILLDASSRRIITKYGYERFLEDRTASSFPWDTPDVLQILRNIPQYYSYSQSDQNGGRPMRIKSFQDANCDIIIGLYFSAYWCPPCKAFTSHLIETYSSIKAKGNKFEVILVSSDRSIESYSHYVSKMPWIAIPYEDDHSRAQLTKLFGIQAIPSLILLNPDGTVIAEDGRGEVNDDPQGLNFPWHQKIVNILTPRLATKLQKNPAIVLFTDGEEDVEIELATAVLTPVAEYVRKKYDDELLFFIANDSDTSDSLREYLRLDDVSPLVTLTDIPLARFAVMEYGKEITEKSITNFINQFYRDELNFSPIQIHIN